MSKELTYKLLVKELDSSNIKETRHASEAAQWYLQHQRDPIIGTQTGRCTFYKEDSTWKMKSSLPLQMDFPADSSQLDLAWDELADSQAQGNALWKYSIGFLPTLLEQSTNFELVNAVIDSLWAYTESEEWQSRSKWMTSLDHCIAVRLRAICTLYFQYTEADQTIPTSLVSLLANDVLNMTRHDDQYFPVNNHGAMAAISLLHACGVFPSTISLISKSDEKSPLEIALSQFNRIIGAIFDEHGVASENSPEYQRYWVSLVKPVADIFKNLSALAASQQTELDFESLQTIIGDAESALQMFTDTSGRLIPIGDTHPRKHSSTPPENKTLITETHGFAIYRSPGMVFTLNSGSVNYAHKHCDDSSITLAFGDEGLILDSGYYSHDWSDPSTIYTKSQTAHSGLFLTALDNIHPGKLYWPGKERIQASLSTVSTEPFHVISNVSIDNKVLLRREVKIGSRQQIDIFDSVSGDISEYGAVVRRFILPLDSQLRIGRGFVGIRKNNVTMDLFFDSISDLDSINVTTAQETPHLKGWISPELKTLTAAHCLEIPVSNKASSFTRIRLDTID